MKKGTKKSLLRVALAFGCLVLLLCLNSPVQAESFFFSTGNPDGKMATASRPSSTGKIEIESADDFVLTNKTSITSATFTGLIPTGASLSDVKNVDGGNLSGVSQRLRCWPYWPPLSGHPSAHPGQFAVGCGICQQGQLPGALLSLLV